MQNRNTAERPSIGPLKVIGIALNSISTAAVVFDKTIEASGSVITESIGGVNDIVTTGREALNMTLQGTIDDMRMQGMIDEAHRSVSLAQAKAEVSRILAQLEAPEPTTE